MGRYREHPARCRLRRKLPLVFTVLLPPAVPPPGLFLNVHSIQQVPFNVQVSEGRVNLNLKHLLILCSRGPEGGLSHF